MVEWSRLRLLKSASMPGLWFVSPSQSSPSIQLSQRRACRLSPLVPTRSHNHLLRFSKTCPRAGILLCGSASLWHRAHALLALCYIFAHSLILWLQARIVYVSTRSAPQFDRSPREGAPCATMSKLTCYRTSRSFHFPFWAVCSLSGSQPEIWSVSWKPPVLR